MHSQSPQRIFHCLRAVKRIHQTQETVWSWRLRARIELKLKVMFREQNKRKPRKDGME